MIERAAILSRGPLLEVEQDLMDAMPDAEPVADPTLEAVERAHIVQTLEATAWVGEGPRGAARILGMHPNTLRSRMKKLGITRPSHELS